MNIWVKRLGGWVNGWVGGWFYVRIYKNTCIVACTPFGDEILQKKSMFNEFYFQASSA